MYVGAKLGSGIVVFVRAAAMSNVNTMHNYVIVNGKGGNVQDSVRRGCFFNFFG